MQKLNFSWEGLEAAANSLESLLGISYELGESGAVDAGYLERFTEMINDDLNLPRALALTWELVRADLPAAVRKATLLQFDAVLGLGLAEWKPPVEEVPEEIQELVALRQQARAEKRWQDADALRERIMNAGWELMDTPEGPKLKPRRN
jgi:cysteinyl-tRNA synthetase